MALLNYIFSDKKEGMIERAEFLTSNYCGNNLEDIKNEWTHYIDARMGKPLKSPAMHFIFGVAQEDKDFTQKEAIDFVHDIVEQNFNLSDYSYVAVAHNDTDSHYHIHLAVLKISPNLTVKTFSDSNSFKIGEHCCRKAEEKYNLKKVHNSWDLNAVQNDQRKKDLKEQISLALPSSFSMMEFTRQMNQLDVKVKIVEKRGIVFIDPKGMIVKGSDKQIDFSLQIIKNIIAKNNDNHTLHSLDNPPSEVNTENKSSDSSLNELNKGNEADTQKGLNVLDDLANDLAKPTHIKDDYYRKEKKKKYFKR